MAAYASVAAYVDHKLHPRVLVLIVVGHAAVIAALMLAKMDLPPPILPKPITVYFPTQPAPPPPRPVQQPKSQQPQALSILDHPQQVVQTHEDKAPQADTTLPVQNFREVGPQPLPPLPPSQPMRSGPRLATAPSDLRPPYPEQKLLAQEEATLRLRLTIDAAGRVTAVDPIGSADPAFLAAARRHILAHWRYRPATEDGHPMSSSTVITLQFQLDG